MVPSIEMVIRPGPVAGAYGGRSVSSSPCYVSQAGDGRCVSRLHVVRRERCVTGEKANEDTKTAKGIRRIYERYGNKR